MISELQNRSNGVSLQRGESAGSAEEFVDDRSDSGGNNPPNHGQATHSSARFLEWAGRLDRDVSVSNLGELYQEWQERQERGEQSDLSGWSE